MSKMKTNRGATKRFKKTAGGIKRKAANLRHILTKRSTNQKRPLRAKRLVSSADEKMVREMIG